MARLFSTTSGSVSNFDLGTSCFYSAQMFLYTMPATWLWHLTPCCCGLPQGHLCAACTCGPAWCGRTRPLSVDLVLRACSGTAAIISTAREFILIFMYVFVVFFFHIQYHRIPTSLMMRQLLYVRKNLLLLKWASTAMIEIPLFLFYWCMYLVGWNMVEHLLLCVSIKLYMHPASPPLVWKEHGERKRWVSIT